MGKTLVFAVFDFDRFTKNDEIGEVTVNVTLVCDDDKQNVIFFVKNANQNHFLRGFCMTFNHSEVDQSIGRCITSEFF